MDWADSTRSMSVPSCRVYVAAPRSGKPVGWKRFPCTGSRVACMRRRGAFSRADRSIMFFLFSLDEPHEPRIFEGPRERDDQRRREGHDVAPASLSDLD